MVGENCEQCGEPLEAGLAACWKCGRAAPAKGQERTRTDSAANFPINANDPLAADRASVAWLADIETAADEGSAEAVVLTTAPAFEGHRVVKTLEVISAEYIFGGDAFRDWLAAASDFGEPRTYSTRNSLRSARLLCLRELRQEAHRLGANAVIAVEFDHSVLHGEGASMLLLFASGTAVVVKPSSASC
jgi:uncharacterized protein YbjQ (UPF0145 family)